MTFLYTRAGLMEDWECEHGYASQACGVVSEKYPALPDLCNRVGEHMLGWYKRLPNQSHVRLGKTFYMSRDTYPPGHETYRDYEPNLKRLKG